MNTNTALIPVTEGTIQGRAQSLCDARDLHAFLEVRRDFTNWIRQRIAKYGFVENQDFVCVEGLALSPNLANQSSIKNVLATGPSLNVRSSAGRGGDRRSVAYHLTLDMAKQLSMVENNERGRQARRYFIECERIVLKGGSGIIEPPDIDDGYPPIGIIVRRGSRVWMIIDHRVREIRMPLKGVVVGDTATLMRLAMGDLPMIMVDDTPDKYDFSVNPLQVALRPQDSMLLLTSNNDPIITRFHPNLILIGECSHLHTYVREHKTELDCPVHWLESDIKPQGE